MKFTQNNNIATELKQYCYLSSDDSDKPVRSGDKTHEPKFNVTNKSFSITFDFRHLLKIATIFPTVLLSAKRHNKIWIFITGHFLKVSRTLARQDNRHN